MDRAALFDVPPGSMSPTPSPDPQLPLARYRLRFRVGDQDAVQRLYLGSAWRGAFGRALRRSACITNLPSCDNCALLDRCAYPRTFEKRTPASSERLRLYPTVPNPYVLAPPYAEEGLGDDAFTLGVTLFGAANDDAPAILQALVRAARDGLTGRRVVFEHLETQAETPAGAHGSWSTIQRRDGGMARSPVGVVQVPPMPLGALRVCLLSPLRIRSDERYVRPRKFEFRAFAANLLRRVSLLAYFFGTRPLEADFSGLLAGAASVRIEDARLRWWEGDRYSSRQRARVPMGGIVGSFVAQGPALAALWPCLWLGQWTHVGKGCTMGLGRYALEPADGASHWPEQARR